MAIKSIKATKSSSRAMGNSVPKATTGDNRIMGNIAAKVPVIPQATIAASVLHIELTPEQRYTIGQLAALANMTLDAYVRARVLFVAS